MSQVPNCRVIARQVQRMSLLLDDLLDMSRITRDQLELMKDYVDLRSVVARRASG